MNFDYKTAFSRNLGLISHEQQDLLRNSCVAIAGLGGVGSAQALALARMGIGSFVLADLDIFELSNFNRQLGASVNTIGKKKVEVIRDQILAINPLAKVKMIDEGINAGTIDNFLDGSSIVLDALDFNCLDERFILYKAARKKCLWILNTPPPGFGSALLAFDPQGMTFEEYFDLDENFPVQKKAFLFLCGITPSRLVFQYINHTELNLQKGRFPCVSPAFFICAGITATEVFSILARRMPPQAVPWVYEFDALRHIYKKQYYLNGMRNPWQFLRRWLFLQELKRSQKPK